MTIRSQTLNDPTKGLLALWLCLGASVWVGATENEAMTANLLVEWSVNRDESASSADVTVFQDGQVHLSERMGGGDYELSPEELRNLRTFLFQQQRLAEIDPQILKADVDRAAATRRARSDSEATRLTTPNMDAGTTLIRAEFEGRSYTLQYHDLTGDASAYPEVDELQHLRNVELSIIELAQRLASGSH